MKEKDEKHRGNGKGIMRTTEVFSCNTRDFFVVILANLRFNSQSKPN